MPITRARLRKHTQLKVRVAPTNTVAATVSGIRTVGSLLTVSNGTWTNLNGLVLDRQWLRNGAGIPGETGATYLQAEADVGQTVTCRVSVLHLTGVVASTPTGVVVRPALTIVGSPSPGLAINTAYSFVPTLAGGASPYTVASIGSALPTGLSLNTSTGAVTGTATVGGTFGGIILRVTDADGLTATLNFPDVVVTVPATPGQTSITHNGETITVSSAVRMGVSPSGLPWIDTSQGDVVVTGFSTPSASVASDDWIEQVLTARVLHSGESYQAHGAEWCPFFIPYVGEGGQPLPLPAGATSTQGLSQRYSVAGVPVSTPNANVSGNAGLTGYNGAQNIDPGNTGQSFVIPQGTTGSIVKMIDRLDGPYGMRHIANNRWRRPEKYAVFTFVNGVPPATALMPSASLAANDPRREEWFLMSEADKGSLGPGLDLPASWDAIPYHTDDLLWQPFFGQFGEYLRMWVIAPTVGSSDLPSVLGESTGYSRDYSLQQSKHLAQLIAQGPAADDTRWAQVLQIGIQLFGLAMRGHIGVAGAGQAAGYKPMMQFVLHAFHAVKPELLDLFQDFRANYTHQQFWVNESLLGTPVNFDGNHDHNMGTFLLSHLDMSMFAHTMGLIRDTPLVPRADGTLDSVRDTDYEIGSASQANTPEMFVSALLQNGPGDRTGEQVIADMDSWADVRTERSASVDFADGYRHLAGAGSLAGSPRSLDILGDSAVAVMATIWRDFYDAFRYRWGMEIKDAKPEAGTPLRTKTNISSGTGADKLLVATSGGFQWDIRKLGFHRGSTLHNRPGIIDANVDYSLDEVQWVPVSPGGPADYLNGTQTGLTIGRPHSVRWRRSALVDGVKTYGPYSVNFKRAEKAGETSRMVVTPTGTVSVATPVFTVQPVLHYRPAPAWWGPHYEPLATSPFDHRIQQIYAGVGYITGNLTGGVTYQWQRKIGGGAWTDIPLATTAGYFWTFEDMSADLLTKLRCRIRTVTESVDAYTNELAIETITESELLELNMVEAPPGGLMADLQTYFNNLKAGATGDLYAATDMLKLNLHTAQASTLNLKVPGGKGWDTVLSGIRDAVGNYNGMYESDFTPYLGFQGNGVDKWLAFNFLDTSTSATNWSLNKGSLVVKVNNTLNQTQNKAAIGASGSNSTSLTPNVSNNVSSQLHSLNKLAGPSSSGTRLGWSASIREDVSGFYNYREASASALSAQAPLAGSGTINGLKQGSANYASDRVDVFHIGAFTRAQYLEFRTITDAFLIVLAGYA